MMLELAPPVRVDQRKGHFWFPIVHALAPEAHVCLVGTVPDAGSSHWRSRLYFSRDALHWRDLGAVPTGLASIRRDAGLLVLPYEFRPAADRRGAVGRGVHLRQAAGGEPVREERDIAVTGFPGAIASYADGKAFLMDSGDDVLTLADGALFHTLYGRLAGDRKYRLFAVASRDGGLTWRYRATVADGQTMRTVREGPSEAATVRLADGGLLCVYRVDSGAASPFRRSVSRDEGMTWAPLPPMRGKCSVRPQLVRLDDGTLLLSGGRPGIHLWVCTDGMGRRWRRHDLVAHHNRHMSDDQRFATPMPGGGETPAASTCYTSMRAIGPDAVLIAYDRLGNGWQGAPGPHGATDAAYCVRVRVTR